MSAAMIATVPGLAVFLEGRRRLFGIAYRILGSAAEAEDVVQDVWLRWQLCDRSNVREPMAFLATATTRAAINVLQSARSRHEAPPLGDDEVTGSRVGGHGTRTDDPADGAERDEVLESAMRLLLERLSAAERAAFVLRVGFDYPYSRIAALIETTEVAARQLVSRARKRLADAGAGEDAGTAAPTLTRVVDGTAHRALVRAVQDAAREGDSANLEAVLTPRATSRAASPRAGRRLVA